jgi:magnesium transporter
MLWHDIRDPGDPRLDELAKKYNLHPLHIEDCRNRGQSAKVEPQNNYLFVVLKPLLLGEDYELNSGDLDFFIGPDFLITVQETDCPPVTEMLTRAHAIEAQARPDQLLYRIMDQLVDSYQPLLDLISDQMDHIGEEVVTSPEHSTLERIFDLKRSLIEMRRILANSRDVVGNLLRTEYPGIVHKDTMPFLRDVYDHVMRNLDSIEIYRDLLSSTTELYLTSIANHTNQVMKALTVFGAVATPALVITGMYGMNLKRLPFQDHPHAWGIVMTMIGVVSASVILVLKRLRWL